MPQVIDEERDERLDQALNLLKPPVRKSTSAFVPFLSAVLLTGAGALLIYIIGHMPTAKPATTNTQPVVVQASPGFELSGSSMSAAESDSGQIRDAVIIGTEDSR